MQTLSTTSTLYVYEDVATPPWLPLQGQYGKIPLTNTLWERRFTSPGGFVMPNNGVISAWMGAAFSEDYSPLGAYVVGNGGHEDYLGNDVYVADLSALRWERILDPSPYTWAPASQLLADFQAVGSDLEWLEWPDGSWLTPHTYDGVEVIPASWGVTGPRGAFVISHDEGPTYTTPATPPPRLRVHKCDLASPGWARFSATAEPYSGSQAYVCLARDNGRQCFWAHKGVADGAHYRLDKDGVWTRFTGTGPYVNSNPLVLAYAPPPYDVIVSSVRNADLSTRFAVKTPGTTQNWSAPPIIGTPPTFSPTGNSLALEWDPDRLAFYVWDALGEAIYYIKPTGDPKTAAWEWTRETINASTGAFAPTPYTMNPGGGYWSKLRRIPALKAFAYIQTQVPGADPLNAQGELHIIRPLGA